MMDAKIYWVGEIPGGRTTINVLNSGGDPANLSSFTEVRLRMLDSDNNEVHVEGNNVDFTDKPNGKVVFVWPTTYSLFTKAGEYVLQLELSTPTARRYTSVQTILVKGLEGRRN